ncbi:MAG: M1 family metallopeptidase [Anaerolineae bacterium]|nr:M1 family metallopeptidase [Anaerolineae bacterium]
MKFHFLRLHLPLLFILIVVSLAACQSSLPTATPSSDLSTLANPATPTQPPAATNTPTVSPTSPSPSTASPSPEPASPSPESHFFDETNWDDREIFCRGLISTEQEALGRLPGASVYHLDLQLTDDLLHLAGQEKVWYTNQEDEPLKQVYFRLFPNAMGGQTNISAVKVDGQAVEFIAEFADTALQVPLPGALLPGEHVTIQLDFGVEVTQELAGNYGLFGYSEGVLVLDEFYPTIPVYDDEGWNVALPSPNADLSYNDASFYLVRVTAPANLTLVAAGIEIEREQTGDQQILTFAAGPARDFYLAASRNYTVISKTVGETTVNSYAFPQQTGQSELALAVAADSLRTFNRRFGPYPYTEFDVVSTPLQALGIEYPGLVGISLALYDPNAEIGGLPASILLESTIAHEVAHQWFYNAVGNDQVDEPWLDEALAQYATWLYYLDVYDKPTAQGYLDSWESRWERVGRADIPIGLPAGDYDGKEYGAIVYGRGPLFITALAEEMGQASFDAFLRDYYQTHQWGIATGDTFKQLAEQYCRCDLTNLFETWVYEK